MNLQEAFEKLKRNSEFFGPSFVDVVSRSLLSMVYIMHTDGRILHRDLKAENIVVTTKAKANSETYKLNEAGMLVKGKIQGTIRLYLLDFESAVFDGLTLRVSTVTTVRLLDPCQLFQGIYTSLTPSQDQFCLGLLLFQTFNNGTSYGELFKKVDVPKRFRSLMRDYYLQFDYTFQGQEDEAIKWVYYYIIFVSESDVLTQVRGKWPRFNTNVWSIFLRDGEDSLSYSEAVGRRSLMKGTKNKKIRKRMTEDALHGLLRFFHPDISYRMLPEDFMKMLH